MVGEVSTSLLTKTHNWTMGKGMFKGKSMLREKIKINFLTGSFFNRF